MNHWPELKPDVASLVEAAVARGNKIEAIKIYRKATKCGLKEAKDAVERGEPARTRESSVAGSSGANWFLIIAGLAIFLIVTIVAFLKLKK